MADHDKATQVALSWTAQSDHNGGNGNTLAQAYLELLTTNKRLAETNQENAEKIAALSGVIDSHAGEKRTMNELMNRAASLVETATRQQDEGDLMGLLWRRAWVGNDEEAMWLCDQLWARRRQVAQQRWPEQARWAMPCTPELREWMGKGKRMSCVYGEAAHVHMLDGKAKAEFEAWSEAREGDQMDGDGVDTRWTTCSTKLRTWFARTGRPQCEADGIHQHELSAADRAGFDAWMQELREATP
ncbi:MAG TPA: hypothetical protein VGH72_33735 [Pseudonocardia sp.]|jgi:hypothetical protein